MPPVNNKSPEIQKDVLSQGVEQQVQVDLEKKKLEEQANKELQVKHSEQQIETWFAGDTFDSEVEALQKKVEANQITAEEADKLYDQITKRYDANFTDKAKTVVENVADTMGMRDKVNDKWNIKNTLLWTGLAATWVWVSSKWKSWFGKKETTEITTATEKTPWYKKTWVWLTGLLWLWVLLYKGESIMDWFSKFFEKDAESKKDEMMNDIIKKLWNWWTYDAKRNIILYGRAEYNVDDLMKKWVIVADSKNIINIEKTIIQLQEHVKNPNNVKVEDHNTNNIEETQQDVEMKENIVNYNALVPVINTYAKKHQLGDATITYEQFDDATFAPGLLIADLDRAYRNVDAMLTNSSFSTMIEGSKKQEWWESVSQYPREVIVRILNLLWAGADVVNKVTKSQWVADTNTLLARFSETLSTDKSQLAKQYRDAIIAKKAMILQYLKDVKENYTKKVWSNSEKLKIFSGTINDIIEHSKKDQELYDVLHNGEKNETIVDNQEKTGEKKKYFLDKLSKANTDKERDNLVNEFSDELDNVWFTEWTSLRDVTLWHMFETKWYLDMRMLEEMYGETFASYQEKIQILKSKKWKLTSWDIEELKKTVWDFYDTLETIQLETHVQKHTDDDGRVYATLDFPVIVAGKKVLKTFVMKWNENWALSVVPLALGTIAFADLATYPIRKVLNIVKNPLIPSKWRVVSPTIGIMKKWFQVIKWLWNKFITPEFVKWTPETVKKFTDNIKNLTHKSLTQQITELNKKYPNIDKSKSKANIKKYQQELEIIIKNTNPKIYQEEKKILQSLKKMSLPDRKLLYNSDDIVKKIVDANGWMKLLTATKRWRMFKIWTYVMMASWQWGSSVMNGDKTEETVKEVADFGIGMVPIAGDLYDIGMAIRWKDLNNNEMSTGERRTRWLVWLWAWVANVFTFGLWGTAAKWLIKWWTKLATKATIKWIEKATVKEIAIEWLKQFGKKAAINGAATTLVGWTIVMGSDSVFKEVDLDELSS